jgi:hypothetical protein
VDGLSGDNAGSLEFDSLSHVALDGALTVDGVTEGVNNSAEHALTDGDIDDGTSSLDNITFLDLSIIDKLAVLGRVFSKINKDGSAHTRLRKIESLTYRYRGRQYQHYQFPS